MEDGKDSGKVGTSANSRSAQVYNSKDGYEALKAEKAEALWKAIECVIPDVRERAKAEGAISIVGTPLTHRRYNQRFRGTYGPAPAAGKDVVSCHVLTLNGIMFHLYQTTILNRKTNTCILTLSSQSFSQWDLPGCTTPIKSLLACGDTCFPGIGLPGVAASGTIAANTQLDLMKSLRAKGALQ